MLQCYNTLSRYLSLSGEILLLIN